MFVFHTSLEYSRRVWNILAIKIKKYYYYNLSNCDRKFFFSPNEMQCKFMHTQKQEPQANPR